MRLRSAIEAGVNHGWCANSTCSNISTHALTEKAIDNSHVNRSIESPHAIAGDALSTSTKPEVWSIPCYRHTSLSHLPDSSFLRTGQSQASSTWTCFGLPSQSCPASFATYRPRDHRSLPDGAHYLSDARTCLQNGKLQRRSTGRS